MIGRLPSACALGFIKLYRLLISPFMPPVCRFHPSCSAYGLEAFNSHSFCKAFGLTVWRILRCNPWNKGPMEDPCPPAPNPSPTSPHDPSHHG